MQQAQRFTLRLVATIALALATVLGWKSHRFHVEKDLSRHPQIDVTSPDGEITPVPWRLGRPRIAMPKFSVALARKPVWRDEPTLLKWLDTGLSTRLVDKSP